MLLIGFRCFSLLSGVVWISVVLRIDFCCFSGFSCVVQYFSVLFNGLLVSGVCHDFLEFCFVFRCFAMLCFCCFVFLCIVLLCIALLCIAVLCFALLCVACVALHCFALKILKMLRF